MAVALSFVALVLAVLSFRKQAKAAPTNYNFGNVGNVSTFNKTLPVQNARAVRYFWLVKITNGTQRIRSYSATPPTVFVDDWRGRRTYYPDVTPAGSEEIDASEVESLPNGWVADSPFL